MALYPEFTVEETLNFFGRLYGLPLKQVRVRAQELLELLDLRELRRRQIRKLSGGQARRVSFCCALLHRPRLLILDEPTVGRHSDIDDDGYKAAHLWCCLDIFSPLPWGLLVSVASGVDPLLRCRIWTFLVDLVRNSTGQHPTSIIITTHYIEEARQVGP